MGKLAVIVLAVLTLAACAPGTGAASQPPSAAQVARELGATGVQRMDPTLYAYDEATATLHGRRVDIATFRTNTLRDKWITAASQFSGIERKGDRYAVADG